jgi:predicted metal-dependent hydrolase
VRYSLPQPSSVRWVDNQLWRWASCTPEDRSIRVSSRVAAFPAWVIDGVLVHELAHLVEAGHGPAFWGFANRYPKMERVRGFLIAKGGEDDDDAGDGAFLRDSAASTAAETGKSEVQPALW